MDYTSWYSRRDFAELNSLKMCHASKPQDTLQLHQARLVLLQAGGASRIVEENRIAAEESPCEADNPSDVMTRMGNYLGSWLGLGSVPEHEGPGD